LETISAPESGGCNTIMEPNAQSPNILKAFIQADPDLIKKQNEEQNDDLPIHCFIRSDQNPNVLGFLILFSNEPRLGKYFYLERAASYPCCLKFYSGSHVLCDPYSSTLLS